MGAQGRSILLLGGSSQQVIAIEAARRLGYRTVLCDYLPDNPGQHHADVFYLESTTDRERMLEIARKEQVSGVLAYASDPAALTAAFVAEELGLPTNPLSAVETLSTKHLFRAYLAEHGFPCPQARPLPADATPADLRAAAQTMRLPVVVKPTDSSGSKGVSVLDALDDEAAAAALASARSFSRNGTLIVEEYIRAGFERVIGGDIFVVDGKVSFWGLMSCLRDKELGGLVPVGERYPTGLDEVQTQSVRDLLSRLVQSLGLRFGELNVEVIMGEDGQPYVLELGARAGGNMIPVQLSDISGIDLVEANVRFAMGDNSYSTAFDAADVALCTYVPHADREGTFGGIEIDPLIEPLVYRVVPYLQPGDRIERFDGANKAAGIVFLRFDSVGQLEELSPKLGSLVRVRV